MTDLAQRRCMVLLGGSFDPVHRAHMALGIGFSELFQADCLRVLPAGNPWQKAPLQAAPEDRLAMLKLAFAQRGEGGKLVVEFDTQEMQRNCATYTIDSLRAIRAEIGVDCALIFVIGADQLQQLDTWQAWREIFSYAHVAVGARPGFSLAQQDIKAQVAQEFYQRAGSIEQIKSSAYGLTIISAELEIDISSSRIRKALQEGRQEASNLAQFLSPEVLDYIHLHHLYQK